MLATPHVVNDTLCPWHVLPLHGRTGVLQHIRNLLVSRSNCFLAEFTQEYESYKGDLFGFCRGGWGPREGKADPPLWQVAELLQKIFSQRYMKHVSKPGYSIQRKILNWSLP